MSIQGSLSSAFQAVAAAMRTTRTKISGNVGGDISGLSTVSKSSMLSAVNEIVTRRSIGFRHSFALTNQPRTTWIQPTSFTALYNNPVSTFSLASGTLTMGANTVANVVGNWLFHMNVWLPDVTGCSVGCEIRIGGTAIARTMLNADTNPYASLSFPYYISGGQALTFHVYHTYTGVLGIGSNTAISGIISGAPM